MLAQAFLVSMGAVKSWFRLWIAYGATVYVGEQVEHAATWPLRALGVV